MGKNWEANTNASSLIVRCSFPMSYFGAASSSRDSLRLVFPMLTGLVLVCAFLPCPTVNGIPANVAFSSSSLEPLPVQKDLKEDSNSDLLVADLVLTITSNNASATCGYVYTASDSDPSICGNVSVDGSDYQVRYTANYFQLWAVKETLSKDNGWRKVAENMAKLKQDVLPFTDTVVLKSYETDIKASMRCREQYEPIHVPHQGFYCRVRGKSARVKPVPAPSAAKTITEMFDFLQCQASCASSEECVAATFDYMKHQCLLHEFTSFHNSTDKAPRSKSESDIIYLSGDRVHMLNQTSKHLKSALNTKASDVFMGPAKVTARQAIQYTIMMQNGLSKTVEEDNLVQSIATIILETKGGLNTNRLPARDGPATVDT
eukprot:Nk52_evm5s2587 gene=Nk52_evmTU5s2587